MKATWRLEKAAELPPLPLAWTDRDGTIIDFSTGWTFTMLLASVDAKDTIVNTKTTGFTGAATSPNLLIARTLNEYAALADGFYEATIIPKRTSDNFERDPFMVGGSLPTIELYSRPV